MRNIIKQQQSNGAKKRLFTLMNDWLNQISTITNEKIRETLYNIEQFRPDVVNLTSAGKGSQASGNQSSGSGNSSSSPSAKGGISSSTKTSGTTNMVASSSTGGNSITGKNPFAILKASAIASTSTAKFPNNFQNLPKATPPFLPPLEGEDKNTKYTLVLDLDETLIHNVEVREQSFGLYFDIVWKR